MSQAPWSDSGCLSGRGEAAHLAGSSFFPGGQTLTIGAQLLGARSRRLVLDAFPQGRGISTHSCTHLLHWEAPELGFLLCFPTLGIGDADGGWKLPCDEWGQGGETPSQSGLGTTVSSRDSGPCGHLLVQGKGQRQTALEDTKTPAWLMSSSFDKPLVSLLSCPDPLPWSRTAVPFFFSFFFFSSMSYQVLQIHDLICSFQQS